MKNIKPPIVKILLSISVILLAIIRFIFFDTLGEKIDPIFLFLLASAVAILILPWERLESIKAGGIELSLNKKQAERALKGLDLDRMENKQLKEMLLSKASEIELIKGSRILWIDDNPHNLIGERRLLRELGLEVVMVISSEMAEEILNIDNDFDMIISDVQRKGTSYKLNNGIQIHEGVNFIVKLRNHKDLIIKTLPVAFYAAYSWDRLKKFTKPAREIRPKAEISNTIEGLLNNIIMILSEVRSNPIKVRSEKEPTRIK